MLSRHPWYRRLAVVLLVAALIGAGTAALLAGVPALPSARAQACTVTDLSDGGEGTLRDHLADPTCAVIDFDPGLLPGTIVLESQIVIDRDVAIEGPGAEDLAASGDNTVRVFSIEAGNAVEISGVTISDGDADYGGGINNSGALTLSNSVVTGNTATQDGGGIYQESSGTLALKDSVVRANTAGSDGGGIYNNGLTVTLTNSSIGGDGPDDGNSAGSDGGGILTNGGDLTMTDTDVTGNSAGDSGDGGGIYQAATESTVTLANSAVTGNTAGRHGGGMFISAGSMTLLESDVSDNLTFDTGGGIFNEGALLIESSSIAGNVSETSAGGAFYNFNGTVTVVSSTIRGNAAAEDGGAIAVSTGDVTVVGSTISDNTVSGSFEDRGAAISNITGTVVVINSTLSGNTAADHGGAVFSMNEGASTTLINVTVAANAAKGEGGGIYINNGVVTAINTIVADQQSGGDCAGAPPGSGGHNLDSDGTCGLTEPGDISEGNANLGPLADNGGPTLTHRLLESSDAIDAGDDGVCAAEPVDAVDQRGVPRPQRQACDIGAFEVGVIRIWGDLDCDGNVVIGDALKTARHLLDLSVSQEEGCPEPGEDALVNAGPRTWGDVDCDANVAIGDALKIARWLLGLSVSQEEGCPEIGTEVEVAL